MLYLKYDPDTETLYIYDSIDDAAMPVRDFTDVKEPQRAGDRLHVTSNNNILVLNLAYVDVHIINPLSEESSDSMA